jgi:putative membrane protein
VKFNALIPFAAALVVLSGCGEATKSSSSATPSPDSTAPTISADNTPSAARRDSGGSFLGEAAQGNMGEVKLGKLAELRAVSADAKTFAKHMIDDHSANLQKVKVLAANKGYTLPADVSDEDAQLYAKLEKLSGPEFDRAYVNAMVNDHRKDVAEFERQSNTAQDSDLKTYAAETLPTLRHHLQMAEESSRKLNSTAASSDLIVPNPIEVRQPESSNKDNPNRKNQPETSR